MKREHDDLDNAGAGVQMLVPAYFATRLMIDDGWRIPDEMWDKIKPLLPPRKRHPLGCHNPRVPDRDAMNAILLVLRTGCKWTALDSLGLCSHSSAHRRYKEWQRAGVFQLLTTSGIVKRIEICGAHLNHKEPVSRPSKSEIFRLGNFGK